MPRIVLIVADQLRADASGPNLDRIAASSLRFECIANPLCRPARITLMTGQTVVEHGFDSNLRVPAPESVPSHVRELRDLGWSTAVVGKTHLHDGTGHLDDHRDVLHRWGFTDAVELPDALEYRLRSAHSDALGERFRQWQDIAANYRLVAPSPDQEPWNLGVDDHLDMFCAEQALRFLDRDYLQVCFPGPHPPFDAPSAFARDPRGSSIPWADQGPVSPLRARYRRRRHIAAEDIAELRGAYFAKVALVDAAIGRVVDALDEDVWLIVTSDHGELLGDHQLTGKVLPYESAIRVPLLIRPPGGVEGQDFGVADHVDVVRKIREIAGLAVEPRGGEDVVFGCLGTVSVRTERYTVTWDRRLNAVVELFDRQEDPEQHHNRAADSQLRVEVSREELSRPPWA